MRVLIAGGGTGGHVYPGLAIAEEFRERNRDTEILFVGTKKGMEARFVPAEGFSIKFIPVEGFVGRSFLDRVLALAKLLIALFKSIMILKEFKADIAIGVGGYASFPVMIVAKLLRVKSVIQEQNILPGIANRLLGRWVDMICVAFEETVPYFPAKKVVVTGNPLRKKLLVSPNGRKDEKFTIFVIGGSQGAHQLNQVMIEALDYLEDLKNSLRIIHQTGEKDYSEVVEVYSYKGFDAEIYPFISEMERFYPRAHLVICRAGALTISELMVFKKASILIPFPYAAHRHQEFNALKLVKRDAARMLNSLTLNGEILAREIKNFFQYPLHLKEMERRAGELAQPEAAKVIVDHCYQLVRGGVGV